MTVHKKAWELTKDTFVRFSDNGGSLLGAAIAFYTLLSIAPLLLVVLAVAGWVLGEEAARGQLVDQLSLYIGKDTAQMVSNLVQTLHDTQMGTNATLIGTVLVLWTAARLFGQLQDALNQLWHVRTEFKGLRISVLTLAYKKLVSFLLVLTVGAMFIAFIIATTVASALKGFLGDQLPGSYLLWSAAPTSIGLVLIGVLVTLLYRFLPDATVAWRDAAAGAAVTAVLFAIAEFPLSYYLAHQGVETAYGAAGSLVLLLLWVYYSAQIFFLGAQFTILVAEKGGRRLQPDATAILVEEVPVDKLAAMEAHDAGAEGPDRDDASDRSDGSDGSAVQPSASLH